MRWTGRLLTLGGAQLLVTSDGDRFRAVVEGEHEVSEGDIVLVLPGPEARLELPDGGSVSLPSPALIALGERDGRPCVLLAHGYLEVDGRDGRPVAVDAAGREFTADGLAEFTVAKSARVAALEWASQALARTATASLLPDVHAAVLPRAEVTAHARTGSIEPRSGERILPGQASVFAPGTSGTPPFRIGGGQNLRPLDEFLTVEEIRALRALLIETDGDRGALAAILDEPVGPPPARCVLAAWLMGELGHPDGIPALRSVIDARPMRGAALRSAAAASLVRLMPALPRDLVSDPQPAVAEAVLLGGVHAGRDGVTELLTRVFHDEDLTSGLRVLAAALLQQRDYRVPDALLVGFLTDDDLSVAGLVARTLARDPTGQAHLVRYLPEAGDDLAAVILRELSMKGVPTAEANARARLTDATGKTDAGSRNLFAAALGYLGAIRAPDLDDAIGLALRVGDRAAKNSALVALHRRRSGKNPFPDEAERILRSSNEATHVRISALNLLYPEGTVPEDMEDDPDSTVVSIVRERRLDTDGIGEHGTLARSCLEGPRSQTRASAWNWLGRHAPVEAIERAERGHLHDSPRDAREILSGLAVARETVASDRARPDVARTELEDRLATLFGSVIDGMVDRPAAKDDAMNELRKLARGDRNARARSVIQGLAASRDTPHDLRRKAGTILASFAETKAQLDALSSLLASEDEGVSSSVAGPVSTRRPPLPAPTLRRLRRAAAHARARARLALCEPFDPTFTGTVLDEGDPRAAAILLVRMTDDEAVLVREAIQRRLGDETTAIRILAAMRLARTKGAIEIPDGVSADADPWFEIAILAARAVRGEAPAPATLASLTASVRRNRLVRPLDDALGDFGSEPSRETAGALIDQAVRFPPVWVIWLQTNRHDPPPGRVGTFLTREAPFRSRAARDRALARIRSGETSIRLVETVRSLSAAGTRGDLMTLFELAENETMDEELRHAAVRAAARLLSRHVAESGPARDSLRAWWSERSFALPVPVLPR